MDSLYVLQPGFSLRKDGDTIKVFQKEDLVEVVPATQLKQIALSGRTSVSGQVLEFLIKNKVDTIFMTLDGRFQARLLLDEAGHVELRCRQYELLTDHKYALKAAIAIVSSKLENQATVLQRRRKSDYTEQAALVAVQIKALKQRLVKAVSMDEIRGIEGYGSRLFFSVFNSLILNENFSFSGRNRRPPKDPVNALLSFIYTLFTNEVVNGIKTAGLDPYLGCLHEIASGRPSLACDLVEEWRLFAERIVLSLINKKMIRPEDFDSIHGADYSKGELPVSMKPAAVKAVIATYRRQLEKKLYYQQTGKQTTLRWIIHSQCRKMAEALLEKRLYEPFTHQG